MHQQAKKKNKTKQNKTNKQTNKQTKKKNNPYTWFNKIVPSETLEHVFPSTNSIADKSETDRSFNMPILFSEKKNIVLRLEEFKVYGRQVDVQGGCESDRNLDEHIWTKVNIRLWKQCVLLLS